MGRGSVMWNFGSATLLDLLCLDLILISFIKVALDLDVPARKPNNSNYKNKHFL